MPKSKSAQKGGRGKSTPKKSSSKKVACPKSYKKVVYNSKDKKGVLCERKSKQHDDDWASSSSESDYSYSSSSSDSEDGVFAHRANKDHMGDYDEETNYNTYGNIGAGTFNLNHATCKDLPAGQEGEISTLPNGKVCQVKGGKWTVLNPTTDADCKINFNDDVPRKAMFLKEKVQLDDGTSYGRGFDCVKAVDVPLVEYHLSELSRQAKIATLAIDKYDAAKKEVQDLLTELKNQQNGYHKDAATVEKSIREQSAALYKKRQEIAILENRLRSAQAKAVKGQQSSLAIQQSDLQSQASKLAAQKQSIDYVATRNRNAFGYLDEAGRRGIHDEIKATCDKNSSTFNINSYNSPDETCGQYVVLPWLLKLAANGAAALRGLSMCDRINKILSILPDYKFMDKGVSHPEVCGKTPEDINKPQGKAVTLIQVYLEHVSNNTATFSNKQREDMAALLASVNYVSTDCHNCKETAAAYADTLAGKRFYKGQPPKMQVNNHFRDQRYFF